MAQVRIHKRGKTFSYIFEAGKVDGKRKVVEKGGFLTKDAAYKAGVEAYTDYLHGNIGITSESITLKDFMTQWLENSVAPNVKPRTLITYNDHLKNQISPQLGEIKVQDITPAILDKWIHGLLKTGLSHSTIISSLILINSALKYAVYPAQLISSNPAVYIKVPKNAPRNIIKRHIITPEKFKALLEKYPFGTPYYIPLLILYHTGMRLSEMLGLSWNDIDFAEKKINLTRQRIYLNKRGYYLAPLKTKNSERYIIVDDFLIEELQRWRAQQIENEKLAGEKYICNYYEPDGHIVRQSQSVPLLDCEKIFFICTRGNGQMVHHENLIRTLRENKLNAHSFRHTHATQLIEYGVKPKAVAGRLGHSNIQITQNLYTHNTLKLQEEAAAIFAQNLQTNT